MPALSPPSCCFSLSRRFSPSLWSGFYSWPIFLHSSTLDILALTLSMLFPFPFILLFPPSLLPSSSLNLSNTLFLSVFHTLLLSHIALAVLRPFRSICAVSNGSPQTSWLERRKKECKTTTRLWAGEEKFTITYTRKKNESTEMKLVLMSKIINCN